MVKAPLGTLPQQYWDVFGEKRSIPEYPDNAPSGVPGKYVRNVQQDHASNNNISHGERKNNPAAESSRFEFSENAPTTRQSRLNTAWKLFDDGYNPTEYYADNPKAFDIKTSNLLTDACRERQEAVFDDTVNEVIDMLDTEFAREDSFQFSENRSFKATHSTPWPQDFPEVQNILVWNTNTRTILIG